MTTTPDTPAIEETGPRWCSIVLDVATDRVATLPYDDLYRSSLNNWLREHEIDPMDVVAGHVIAVDEEQRQIRHLGWWRDQDGRRRLAGGTSAGFIKVAVAKQLDEPPAPLPLIIERRLKKL
jgi:hypothetical protein